MVFYRNLYRAKKTPKTCSPECKNMQAFEFYKLLNKNMFNWILNIPLLLILVGEV